MKLISSVSLATIWILLNDILVTSAQELVLKPVGDAHYKPLGGSLLLTCEITNAVNDVNYGIKWFGSNNKEITDITASSRYVEEESNWKKLYLANITETDAGIYTCNATIDGKSVQKVTRLQIFREITFVDTPSQQALKINSDAVVRCNVIGEPKPDVSWRSKGKRIYPEKNPRYTLVPGGLAIKDVTTADGGEYTCSAEVDSDGRYDERKIKVEVHIPPKISEGPGKIEGVEGGEATFQCRVGAGSFPEPTFQFFKDNSNVPLESSGSIKIDAINGRIQFEALKKSDEGTYRCKAANDVGDDSASGSLRVLVKPQIYELNSTIAREKTTGVLICKSHGDPQPQMTFSKQGQEAYPSGSSNDGRVVVSQDKDGSLTLSIKNLSPDDSGDYICRSNSSLGSHEMTASITVEYKPRFAEDKKRIVHGWSASSHNITCRANGHPSPKIVWILRDQQLQGNGTFQIYDAGSTSNLLVNIDKQDNDWVFTTYNCRAENSIGQATLPIELQRATIPSQPAEVNVNKSLPTMLILNVQEPKQNGGMPIVGYRIEYKDKLVTEFAAGTKIKIENLQPNTSYTIVVRAKNDVGVGPGINITAKTEPIREPHPLVITSPTRGQSATKYRITWDHPDTGGRPIKDFEIKIRQVKVINVNGTERPEPLNAEWITINRPDDQKRPMVEYELTDLLELTSYEVEIRSRNEIGWSEPSPRFLFTTSQAVHEDQALTDNSSPISVGIVFVIAVIVLIIILVIVDLSCYFVNNCGLTSLICVKVCGRTAPLNREKTAEEGESKEALTEKQCPAKEPVNNEQTTEETTEKVVTESNGTAPDDHDKKPLLIDDADVKKEVPADESKQDDNDDEPIKQKIEEEENTTTTEEQKQEKPDETTKETTETATEQTKEG